MNVENILITITAELLLCQKCFMLNAVFEIGDSFLNVHRRCILKLFTFA